MANKKPLVTVITPAYNAEKFIVEAIDSVLNQTYKEFEYIIIDDCSTDKTLKIAQTYAKKDKRVRVYKNEKNLGIAGNRNKGVSLAKGKYIMWQDADDISISDRMENQVNILEKNKDMGIVGGALLFFDEKGEHGRREYPTNDLELRKIIYRYSPVAQPAAMIRKSILDECGEYKYPPTEDLDMSFRIGRISKFANLDKIVIKYRESEGSATYSQLRRMEKNTLKIRWNNRSSGYRVGLKDIFFNLAQAVSLFLIPSKLKIALFKKIRNTA